MSDEFTMKSAAAIDGHAQQREGSLASRFERLLDLYAPMTEQADGTTKRDPSCGLISREDFIRFLGEPAPSGSNEQEK